MFLWFNGLLNVPSTYATTLLFLSIDCNRISMHIKSCSSKVSKPGSRGDLDCHLTERRLVNYLVECYRRCYNIINR